MTRKWLRQARLRAARWLVRAAVRLGATPVFHPPAADGVVRPVPPVRSLTVPASSTPVRENPFR